jgi:hypothetical protein
MYRSVDGGRTWAHFGSIPYARVGTLVIARAHVAPEMPAGNWLAVMRSGRGPAIGAIETDAPLLVTRSYDRGATWTEPEVIRGSSTNPIGGLLPNGVVARLYGRPGQFITFCGDGEGKQWGNDVTLVDADPEHETTCCNPEWLVTGPDSFLVAYSSYRHRDPLRQVRKAILVREVTVTR